MKQLTIRGVSEDLHRKLKSDAELRNQSINRYVLTIIRERVGLSGGDALPEAEFNDLDHLAGTWSEEQYREFQDTLQGQRTIDQELWQ